MSVQDAPKTIVDLGSAAQVYRNLSTPELVQLAIERGEGELAVGGVLVAKTGKYTGRTPKDKFVVKDSLTADKVDWSNNQPMDPATFASLVEKVSAATQGKTLFVVDAWAGADPKYRIAVRMIVENAYHALFISQLLIKPTPSEAASFTPEWTIVDYGTETWEREGRDAVIALNLSEKAVLVMGTLYAGEMKKSVFTIMNFLLPEQGVMSMHCSANIGRSGDTALYFGLSGTGKTTLSADPDRFLIGDDEHGWSDEGIFNIEGGCYAKCIKLSKEGEPAIWDAIRFGAVLENVVLTDGRVPDYDDTTLTENTRCAYPLSHIEGAVEPSVGGHPKNVFFLTCDALGVLPPISQLTPEQAKYHFLNGYTAKVAGTEAGVTEPQLTFSTCFGAPFLPLPPKVYADLLEQKLSKHGAQVWLVNTGWTGGGYGEGERMPLRHTRAMIRAALEGKLADFATDPVFGLAVPVSCPDVPDEILMPRNTWASQDAYDAKAIELRTKFDANFEKYM